MKPADKSKGPETPKGNKRATKMKISKADILDMIGLLGFLIAVVAIFIVLIDGESAINYQSIFIGAMSTMVTILIGWNIFQVFDWKKELEKFDEYKAEIKTEMAAEKNRVQAEMKEIKANAEKDKASTLLEHSASMLGYLIDNRYQAVKFCTIVEKLEALVILSNGCRDRDLMAAAVDGLKATLNATVKIKLEKENVNYIFMIFGKIKDSESIPGLSEVYELLESA